MHCRAEMETCECEMRALQVGGQLRQAASSLESAKADNLALVERLRYVQGYRAQTRGKGRSLGSRLCCLFHVFMCSHVWLSLPLTSLLLASLCCGCRVAKYPAGEESVLLQRWVLGCGEQVHKGV